MISIEAAVQPAACVSRSARALKRLAPNRLAGFTLVEMLVVLAVIALLLAAIVPAIVSISRGQGVTRAIDDISSTCEHARTQAMAHNTWVYVCISNPAAGASANNPLSLIELGSKDGGMAISPAAAGTLDPTDLQILLPAVTVKNAVATLTDNNNGPIPSVLTCTWSIGASTTKYNTIIAFSPQGEAVLDPGSRTLNSWIQVHIAEFRGGVAQTQNTAVIKLSGPSGQVMLLRG